MINHKLFPIFTKLALTIFILAGFLLFFIKPASAEFYVTIATMVMMGIVVITAAIMIRRGRKNEK